MRTMWFLPLTYLSGIHGFALFSPMLFFILLLAHLRHEHRQARAVAALLKLDLPVLPDSEMALMPA